MNNIFRFPYQNKDQNLTSRILLSGAEYCVDCRSSIPFMCDYHGIAEIFLHGDWMIDLDSYETADSICVRSQGLTYYGKQSIQNRDLHGIWLNALHTTDGVFFQAETSRFPKKIPITLTGTANILCDSENLYKAYIGGKKIKSADITIESDLDSAGFALIKDEEKALEFKINNTPGGAVLKLYGADREYSADITESIAYIKITAAHPGLTALVAAVYGADGALLDFKLYQAFVLMTVLTTGDQRINGCYTEYLRSMLLRRIGAAMPEEEPRGELLYPFSMWIRNFIGQSLSSFGFSDEAFEYMSLLDDIIMSDGYFKQSYDLSLTPVLHDWGTMGNDGIGFYLWEWGKLMTRCPEKKPSAAAIRKAFAWLKFNTRWNGLIADGTEPVDLFTSEKTTGSCYTQAIVISGLKSLINAYNNLPYMTDGEKLLTAQMESYASRLAAALAFEYRMSDYFAEYSTAYDAISENNFAVFDPGMTDWLKMIWGMFRSNYLHAYSVLQPGAFFSDPECYTPGFEVKAAKTVERVKQERTCDYDDKLVWCHFPRVDAYSQLGMVLNLLHLGDPDSAWEYLDAYLKYYSVSKLKYQLPECIDTHRMDTPDIPTDAADTMKSKAAEFPFLYPGEVIPETGKGYWRTPSNLIHAGYLFYIFDVMTGIYFVSGKFVLRPRIPSAMLPLSLINYRIASFRVDVTAALEGDEVFAVYKINDEKHKVKNGDTVEIQF